MSRLHPLISLFATALFMGAALAGCDGVTGVDELPPSGDGAPISFSAAEVAQTKTTRSGELTTSNLTSMGVFAYYTGADDFDGSFVANFMEDQQISRTNGTQPWTYSPVKYWPNTAGEKITFFAYAPHSSEFTELDTDPNYVHSGGTLDIDPLSVLPYFTIAPRLQAEKQTDILVAQSFMNHTKTAGPINFQFGHLLTKVVFKVRSTEQIHIDRLNIRGMSTYGSFFYNEDGMWQWDDTGIEVSKVFYSLPDKDAPADELTTVSTFFMIPYSSVQDALLDVYYTNAVGTEETKTNVPFSYIATSSGDAVEYTIVMDKTKLTVTVSDGGDSGKWTDGGKIDIVDITGMDN